MFDVHLNEVIFQYARMKVYALFSVYIVCRTTFQVGYGTLSVQKLSIEGYLFFLIVYQRCTEVATPFFSSTMDAFDVCSLCVCLAIHIIKCDPILNTHFQY